MLSFDKSIDKTNGFSKIVSSKLEKIADCEGIPVMCCIIKYTTFLTLLFEEILYLKETNDSFFHRHVMPYFRMTKHNRRNDKQ
jgi:thymidine kinase